ncbi:FAD-dependent oxidoreductase [Algiphilus sp.]|uniref:NAD(P)/FAD-dependent oxidoreductase n=1 Tax=Algiphilus sp. TaxID=1872431 RepID=UPI0025C4F0B3|nr:FAD-dependent oxidoreductase [Algiphilus sp.]MCK5769876.1 FAD-dependent oxidoreductase [Algiphilus sp.]
MSDSPIVIVGSGHAGYTLAREFRKLDTETPLHIVTRDDGCAYYKPNLSKALAMEKTPDALVQQPSEAAAAAVDATIHVHSTVDAIDPQARTVRFGNETLRYGKLVLATGAQPIRLSALGPDAVSVNSLDDYRLFRDRLTPGCRVLIAGAGLIGCEFANDLAAAGHAVTVVDVAGWPLPRLLPEAQGRALQSGLEAIGVRFALGHGIAMVEGKRARLDDGTEHEFDVLLSAIGLSPDTQLAEAAGLACGRGIRVDAQFRTSAPDVYALGDCVDVPADGKPQPMPYVLPIAHAARALARTLSGAPTDATLPPMPVIVKTPACPTLVCPPLDGEGEWRVSGEAPDLEAVFVRGDGTETGFALTGAATKQRAAFAGRMPPVLAARD